MANQSIVAGSSYKYSDLAGNRELLKSIAGGNGIKSYTPQKNSFLGSILPKMSL